MKKYLAPAAAVIAALGIVGGVVTAQALNHPAAVKPTVQLVQNAAATVTPTVAAATTPAATATATPSPTTTTVAPKPVATTTAPKPAPVQSTQAVAPAPAPIKKAAVVSTDTSSTSSSAPAPAPAPSNTGKVITNPDGSTTIQMQPGQQPPVLPAKTPPPSN